jgi:predicted oxidoreductase
MQTTARLTDGKLAYGCWRLAGSEGATGDPAVAAERGRQAVRAALAAGYTVFDLADIYGGGRCEELFGEVLREHPGVRERLFLVTKCGIRRAGDPAGAPYRYDFGPEYLRASVAGSLRRLGVDHVDLLLLHRPDYLMDPAAVAGAFASLYDAGLVRAFGVSNFRPAQFTALRRACPFPLAAHQLELSALYPGALDDGTVDQCLAHDVPVQAWSPLARGLLADAPLAHLPPAEQTRVLRVRAALDRLARAGGHSRAVVALAWLLRHPARVQPVVGTTDPERLREARQAERLTLSREDWYAILEAARDQRLP